jgi:hypothetical protein
MNECLERAIIGLLREPVGEKTNKLRGHVGQANGRKLSWTWNGPATLIRLHDRPPAFRLFDDMNVMDENAGTEVLVINPEAVLGGIPLRRRLAKKLTSEWLRRPLFAPFSIASTTIRSSSQIIIIVCDRALTGCCPAQAPAQCSRARAPSSPSREA